MMGRVPRPEFVVETKGRCFLCWNQNHVTTSPRSMRPINNPSPTHSLQYLARYLEMDLTKAFLLGKESIQSHLVAQVESSRLKVELCDDCVTLTDTFSDMYRQLEMIQMKVTDCLKLIHGKLRLNEGDQVDTEAYIDKEWEEEFGGELQVAEVLRVETLQKCSSKLSNFSPRIKIQRVSLNKFKRETTLDPSSPYSVPNHDANIDEDYSNDFDTHLMELEGMEVDQSFQQSAPIQSEMDEPNRIAMQHEMDVEEPTPIMITPSTSNPSSSAGKSNYKYSINFQTGRYRCALCPREYERDTSVQYHYNSVHRRLRYQCPVPACNTEFTQISNYRRHHQTQHAGVTYNCGSCDKVFRQEAQLRIHRKNKHAEQGYECKYCSQLFPTMSERDIHAKLYCPGNVGYSMTTIAKPSSVQDPSKPFECYICHKRFESSRERTKHYHNHPCPQCGKRFKRITSVRDHIQAVHLGIRFPCENTGCDKLCPDRSTLNKHKKICNLKSKIVQSKVCNLTGDEGTDPLPSELISDGVEDYSNPGD